VLRSAGAGELEPVIVGFVVGKAVGNSVMRHRVSRQLRAAVSPLLGELDDCSAVVVRALPSAAGRSTAQLSADLAAALRRARGRGDRRGAGRRTAERQVAGTAP
jgi:ribonuclease P protein component